MNAILEKEVHKWFNNTGNLWNIEVSCNLIKSSYRRGKVVKINPVLVKFSELNLMSELKLMI